MDTKPQDSNPINFQNPTVSLQTTINPAFLLSSPVQTKLCSPSIPPSTINHHLRRCLKPPHKIIPAALGSLQAPSSTKADKNCTLAPPQQMADPTAIVPYYDPNDDTLRSIENFLMYDDEAPTLELVDFPSFSDQNPDPIPASTSPNTFSSPYDHHDQLMADPDPNDPFSDPFVWALFNTDEEIENPQVGSSNIAEEINDQDGIGNPIKLSVWPPPYAPFVCSCCLVLREITHTNGNDIMKLEIHGRLGMICHAVREKHSIDTSSDQNHEYQMFDFSNESIGNVKQFLVQYCEERKRSGYIMLQDPLLIFYEALCVGLDWDDSIDTDDFLQASPTNSGENLMGQAEAMNQEEAMNQAEVESNGVRANRSTLSAQRERTGKLTLKDFIKYFHIPIETAAKKVQICPTVMKKICRKHGLTRWPHRKIKSIERKISRKAKSLTSDDVEERAQAQADIEKLQQEIASIYTRFGG